MVSHDPAMLFSSCSSFASAFVTLCEEKSWDFTKLVWVFLARPGFERALSFILTMVSVTDLVCVGSQAVVNGNPPFSPSPNLKIFLFFVPVGVRVSG